MTLSLVITSKTNIISWISINKGENFLCIDNLEILILYFILYLLIFFLFVCFFFFCEAFRMKITFWLASENTMKKEKSLCFFHTTISKFKVLFYF